MSKETEKTVTGLVRFIYPNVIEPRAFKEGHEKKYSIMAVIDKEDTETIDKINNGINTAKEAAKFKGSFKNPLKDGDIEFPDDPNFVGKFFINARSKYKPGVIDVAKKAITDPEAVYSGCYGRLSVAFLAYTEGNKGISCRLKAVQKIKDGERIQTSDGTDAFDDDFGTPAPAEEDFL